MDLEIILNENNSIKNNQELCFGANNGEKSSFSIKRDEENNLFIEVFNYNNDCFKEKLKGCSEQYCNDE